MDGYQALLLVSFGGPERPEDVKPFLRRVTAGRDVPERRLDKVAEHYYAAGGVSPLPAQCRALLEALRTELAGTSLEIYSVSYTHLLRVPTLCASNIMTSDCRAQNCG